MRLIPAFLLLGFGPMLLIAQNALPNLRPPYAPRPTDRYWEHQWHLENRNVNGQRRGPDLNVRGAWERTKGEGVIVAIVDDGVELAHPDLAANSAGDFHFHFNTGTTN